MKKKIILVLLTFMSFSPMAKDIDGFQYIGSYTSENIIGEHYLLNELWLWQNGVDMKGLFFTYAGLGGNGPVKPMIVKINNVSGIRSKNITFKSCGFSFTGQFNANSLLGNLTSGGANWNGGKDIAVFKKGTNIETIENPRGTIKTYNQWLQWVNTLGKVC